MGRIRRRAAIWTVTLILAQGVNVVAANPIGNARAEDPAVAAGEIDRVVAMVADTSVRRRISNLQSFGTRYCNNANRSEVAAYLQREFRDAGVVDVAVDSFLQAGFWQTNVVATIPGSRAVTREIIIGAHTDSYSYDLLRAPGADDNASGTSAIVEIARAIVASGYRPGATFRFIGFAAEEVGLRGARSYASRAYQYRREIVAMLNFDMIAHHNRTQALNQFSLVWYPGAEWLARLDSSMAVAYSTLTPVLTTSGRSGSDSYAFYEQGYPAIFHYERGSNGGYHTPFDLLDSLDMAYAVGIIRAGLATALAVDAEYGGGVVPPPVPSDFALLPSYPNPFNGFTTVAFDLKREADVRLEVFDLLGRRVAALASGPHGAGRHSYRWNADAHPTGAYLVRLLWPDGAIARRTLLLR